jgi:lipooligosaccharide transport system permease protein
VWRRDFDVFRRLFIINFGLPMLEPILYLVALGFGLGLYIKEIAGVPYSRFIAPGLVCVAIMYASYFECTFASFVRMYYQRTFDAIIATPVNVQEVVAGEILWGATRAAINGGLVYVVVIAFGLASPWLILLVLPLGFLGGLLFASLGMISTALVPGIEYFNYPIFLFITPMFLFSGTFFPLDVLPQPVQTASLAVLPLTHLIRIARTTFLSSPSWGVLQSFLWLAVVGACAFLAALHLMHRRLIK